MKSVFYMTLLTIMLILGGMYIYFPIAWPQFERVIFMPYILWFILLIIFYLILQPTRGMAILHTFKK